MVEQRVQDRRPDRGDQHADAHEKAAAAEPLAQQPRADITEEQHEVGYEQCRGDLDAVQVQRLTQQSRGQIKRNDVLGEPEAGHHQQNLRQIAPAAAAQETHKARAPFAGFAEPDFRLRNLTQVVARQPEGQQGTQHERHAPAPLCIRRMGAIQRNQGEHEQRDQIDAQVGGAECGDDAAADEAALVLPRILDRQRHRTGVAAAEKDAIDETQQHEQPVGGHADSFIPGQQCNQQCHDAEAGDRVDGGGATPEPVGRHAEQQPTDRSPQQCRDEHQRGENRFRALGHLRRTEEKHHWRQHDHRQVDVEHVDEFGSERAPDRVALLRGEGLLDVRGRGDRFSHRRSPRSPWFPDTLAARPRPTLDRFPSACSPRRAR